MSCSLARLTRHAVPWSTQATSNRARRHDNGASDLNSFTSPVEYSKREFVVACAFDDATMDVPCSQVADLFGNETARLQLARSSVQFHRHLPRRSVPRYSSRSSDIRRRRLTLRATQSSCFVSFPQHCPCPLRHAHKRNTLNFHAGHF